MAVSRTEFVPVPPRYWWLKRILIGCGVLLLSLFALRLWWGREAHRRLQAEIDKLAASGKPIRPEDFRRGEIPDEQNAAWYLQQAGRELARTLEQPQGLRQLAGEPEKIRKQLSEVRAVLESSKQVLALVRQARSIAAVDWGTRVGNPLTAPPPGWYTNQREIATLLTLAADYFHAVGRDDEFVETLLDAVVQSNAIAWDDRLISQLVAIACRTMLTRTIERVGPTLVVDKGADNASKSSPPPERVRALIAVLLDDRPARDGFRRAMVFERAIVLSAARGLAEGDSWFSYATSFTPVRASLVERTLMFPVKPLILAEAGIILQEAARRVEAARQPSYRAAVRILPQDLQPRSLFGAIRDHIHHVFVATTLNHTFELHFRQIARARMAALRLAIRMYESDRGRLPHSLEELVPAYLAKLPQDPFADDGQTFGYLPDAVGPRLYSIGPDGVDNQGKYFVNRSGRIDYHQLDIPFFLNGYAPHNRGAAANQTGSSEKTVDGQAHVKHKDGESKDNGQAEGEPENR